MTPLDAVATAEQKGSYKYCSSIILKTTVGCMENRLEMEAAKEQHTFRSGMGTGDYGSIYTKA